jgi:predicted small lipoprotein YifL
VALVTAAAFALAGCGRVGPLETPPGPEVSPTAAAPLPAPSAAGVAPTDPYSPNSPAAQERAQKTGFDMYGNPVAPVGQQKAFILDPVLR